MIVAGLSAGAVCFLLDIDVASTGIIILKGD